MRIFKDLFWYFKQEKKSYLIGITALLLIAILNVFPAKLLGDLIDSIKLDTLTVEGLFSILLTILAIALFNYGLRFLWRYFILGASFRLEKTLRSSLYDHFLKMSSSFYHEYRVGDLMAHATNDIKAVQRVGGFGILQLFDSIFTGVSVLIAMAFTVDIKLTLLAIIPMPFMMIGTKILGKKIHTTFTVAQSMFSNLNNKTHESISSMKVTKTFGEEEAEIESFKEETFDVYKANLKVTKYDAAFDPMINIVILTCYVIVFIFGGLMIQGGTLTTGNLITFVSYIQMLIWPMLAFGFLYNNIERGSVSYKRINDLLAIEPEIIDTEDSIPESPKGDISMDLKSFSFSDDEESIALSNINFNIHAGETLGLVGKTGSGKTTIVKLLLRDSEKYEGSIKFGDHEITEYALQPYFKSFGYVPQDQFLFSSTIIDNIRFAKMDATYDEVVEVAKKANIHDDIMGFTHQYETIVGERGVSLSGGQKQRIAIARALLSNPECLILDDALSAVDAKVEDEILETLRQERAGKTTIILAHRFSTLKHAHEILVIEDGSISERGNHNELIDLNGWYATIHKQQELSKGDDSNEL